MELKTSYSTYKNVTLEVGSYQRDGSLAIQLKNKEVGLIATLTVCLCDIFLEENEAYVDTNNCTWALEFIERYKLGEKTGKTGRSGFCTYPVVKFNLERLKEFA